MIALGVAPSIRTIIETMNHKFDHMQDDVCEDPHGYDDLPRWPLGLPARIDYIYDRLGPYLQRNRVEFEATIKASPLPDDEAVHWLGIAIVWNDYHQKYLRGFRLDASDERRIIEAIQAIATGRTELGQLPVSGGAAVALLACYLELADELPYLNL